VTKPATLCPGLPPPDCNPAAFFKKYDVDGDFTTNSNELSLYAVTMTDIGTSTVTEASVDPQSLKATIVRQYALAPGSATIDDAIGTIQGKDFLYILAANASSVNVMALPAAGQATSLQNVSFTNPADELGVTLSPNNIQGMALFIPA